MHKQPVRIDHEEAPAVAPRERHHFIEHEAVVRCLHGGKLLRRFGAFHDLYGVDSMRNIAVEEGRRVAEVYGVTEASSLVVQAVITRQEYSHVLAGYREGLGGRRVAEYDYLSRRQTVEPHDIEVAWSSDGKAAEYQAALAAEAVQERA